jgi:protocatechuate 3,4-dioxygenase beta subunit
MSHHGETAACRSTVSRRDVICGVGVACALLPLAGASACDESDSDVAAGNAGPGAGGGSGSGASGAGGWAKGGTASMSGTYPDPFTDPLGARCVMTCATILGPCYAETIERKDISEAYPGLPVRLAFLVVDESCQPVSGAAVDVWHTRNSGMYSGNDAAEMCTFNDMDAETHRYFRGVQTTGTDGRVDFDTCYPGWYQGRTVHIHVTVRVGAQEYVTTQLYFPADVTAQLFAEHADYQAFGQPDTTNSTDSLFTDDAVLATALQSDGALLAWKVVVLRSSLDETLCDNGGGGLPDGGLPDGAPPDGAPPDGAPPDGG